MFAKPQGVTFHNTGLFMFTVVGISEAKCNISRLSKIEEWGRTKGLDVQLGGRQVCLHNVVREKERTRPMGKPRR